jgi:4-azaleucine resistance transporter AzlC
MSRTKQSTVAGMKDVAPLIIGIVPFGLVAGAAVVNAGFGLLDALGMSLLVNAGASQVVATALFAEGAPLAVVLGTALVVNARMFIYSASIAPVLGVAPRWLRPILGHMLIDQNYVSTMTRGRFLEGADVVAYYVGSWVALASVWQLSNAAGALAGSLVPAAWGLDFAVPLVFLAMLAPALRRGTAVEVAVVTGLASAVLVPVLPLQSGVVVAILAGMAWGALRDRSPLAEEGSQ